MSTRPHAASSAKAPWPVEGAAGAAVSRLHGGAWRARVEEGLRSEEPRRQAQARAEIATADVLRFAGWTVDLHPSGVLVAQEGGVREVGLVVLTFRLGPDPAAAVRAIVRAGLAAAGLPWRCVAHVRRVGAGATEDGVAESIAEDLRAWGLQPERAHWTVRQPDLVVELARVAGAGGHEVHGPTWSHRAREVVEPRLVEACVRRQRAARVVGEGPYLVACVTDRPWPIGGGWWRECLYGRPREVWSAETGLVWSYPRTPEPALFRDPALRAPLGVLCIGGLGEGQRRSVTAHAHPWRDAGADEAAANGGIGPRALRVPGHDRADLVEPAAGEGGDTAALRWYEEGRGSLEY